MSADAPSPLPRHQPRHTRNTTQEPGKFISLAGQGRQPKQPRRGARWGLARGMGFTARGDTRQQANATSRNPAVFS